MSDAATEWVAPYWASWPVPSQTTEGLWVLIEAKVWVFNPNPYPAKVTVKFNNQDGSLYKKLDFTLSAYTSSFPTLPEVSGGAAQGGWVHVLSDRPVLPW